MQNQVIQEVLEGPQGEIDTIDASNVGSSITDAANFKWTAEEIEEERIKNMIDRGNERIALTQQLFKDHIDHVRDKSLSADARVQHYKLFESLGKIIVKLSAASAFNRDYIYTEFIAKYKENKYALPLPENMRY
jgi:hypothetical protein